MASGLSTDKLDELRKQREEARAKKKAEEEQAKKEQEAKEKAEKEAKEKAELAAKKKAEEAEKKKAEQEAKKKAEQEKKEQERKAELERIEKEKAELQAQHEKEKADLQAQLEKEKQEKLENEKRHNEELAKEKEKQIEILKEQNTKVEKDKEKAVQEKNDEINQLKKEKKSVEERLAEKEKRMLAKIRKEQELAKNEENSDESKDKSEEDRVDSEQENQELVYASKVKVIDDEPVIANKKDDREEEEGKVQVGFTMVDKSLVNEAKDNKRYGIKDRGPVFRKLNTIVFYLAIPFMIIWAVLAFGGICSTKVGHTSFANTVYYKVNKETALDGYSNGTILSVKAASLADVKKNDKICVEFRNKETGVKELHLLEISSVSISAGNTSRIITFTIDNDNETLSQYNIFVGDENNLITSKDIRFLGIVGGRDIIIGSFLMLCQNVVGFVFIVLIPAGIILTFQFINLYDSIKFYVKQRKIANANKPKQKKEDNRDKIIR